VRRISWGWLVVAAALVVGLIGGRVMTPMGASRVVGPAPRARGRQQVADVGVGHPTYENLPVTLQLTASIASLREAVLLPETSGYLEQVAVRPGAVVTAGQVLAVIDHSQLEAQVAQSQAQLGAAETGVQSDQASLVAARAQCLNAVAAVRSAAAQLNNAKAGLVKAQATLADGQVTYNREVTLVQQGADAPQTLDDDRAAIESDQSDVDAAQAQIRVAQAQGGQAQAQTEAAQQQIAAAVSQGKAQQEQATGQAAALRNAEIQLGYATVTAPFAGVVVSRNLDPGASITPGTSTSIVTVADLDALYVDVAVTDTVMAMLHRGDRVRILVDAYPGRTFGDDHADRGRGRSANPDGGRGDRRPEPGAPVDARHVHDGGAHGGHAAYPGGVAQRARHGGERALPLGGHPRDGDGGAGDHRQATGDVVAITGEIRAPDTVVSRARKRPGA